MNSELNILRWEQELVNDPDSEFLLRGLKDGFHIVNPNEVMGSVELPNHNSAVNEDVKYQVEQLLIKEINKGRYKLCDFKPSFVSPIGAVPKGDGNYRLIHDCSLPRGQSLNSHSPQFDKYSYESLDMAVSMIKPGSYLAKVDIKSAYRHIPIHPESQKATGLKWKFQSGQTCYMYDTRLPFGARASPTIFHRISQSIKRMMANRGFTSIVAYQDDFLLVAETHQECYNMWTKLIELLLELGFDISSEKLVAPSTSLVFLGIVINTVKCELSLPVDKLVGIRKILCDFVTKTRVNKRQLQSLAGKLNFAAKVVRGGRTFLRRILDSIYKLQHPHHKVRLQGAIKGDIMWWHEFMEKFNGTSHFIEDYPFTTILTDSCSAGGGAFCDGDFVYANWEQDYPDISELHINYKEAAMAVLAVLRWGHLFRNRTVFVFSDNTCTVSIINKCSCRSPIIMSMLRKMFWIAVENNFVVKAKFVKGCQNTMADCVSRLHEPGRLLQLESLINEWYRCHTFIQFAFDTFSLANNMSLRCINVLYKQVVAWRQRRLGWTEIL